MIILGLMTGTSMDGLDACLVNLNVDKENRLFIGSVKVDFFSYPVKLKKSIINIVHNQNFDNIDILNKELGLFFFESSKKILINENIDIISLHGQTISHTDSKESIQIGSPKYLFENFNIPIIYDFRTLDIELGGTGAPLMPFLDWMIYKNSKIDTITLNIGGISNITYIPKKGNRNQVVGFDVGPGMCLIDMYVKLNWNKEMDYNGKYSKDGVVDSLLLKNLIDNKFMLKKPPKSASVEDYDTIYLNKLIKKFKNIPSENFIRTLVNYTTYCIIDNINRFLNLDEKFQLIISGGGVNHPLILSDLKKSLYPNKIERFNFNGINHNYKESLLMALLGYCKIKNIPNNMPSVTGAKKLDVYGEIYE